MIKDLKGPKNYNRFYARDFRNARRFLPTATPPRQKFQGYVDFVFNPDAVAQLAEFNDNLQFREQISSLIQTASLPSVQFKTQKFNQYNIHRTVNLGVDYDPVTITAIDTVNNEWLTLLMQYFSYLYMNPRNKSENRAVKSYDSNQVVTTSPSEFLSDTFDSNAAGLDVGRDANFFERIDMILYHGQKGVQYSMTKPTLTSFKSGEIDYSSSEVQTFEMTFEYESFTVHQETNFSLSDFDKSRFERVDNIPLPGFDGGPNG
jgi:hypothetical protein